jgi:DNA repair protein RadC
MRSARRAPSSKPAELPTSAELPGLETGPPPAEFPDSPPPYTVAERPAAPRTLRAIRGPEDVEDVCRALRTRRFEEFHVLLLNARHEVTRRVLISRGSLNASIVHPREVFRPAILASAASLILVHNHPSGDPEPSEEDLAITRRLVQVGELHGIAVLDHVILARGGSVSLRARGAI